MKALLAAALLFTFTTFAAEPPPADLPWDKMDLGPFHTACFTVDGQVTAKGIAIKVGTREDPATLLFDPELLRMSAAWTGGFLKFPRKRGGLEGQVTPEGEVRWATGYAPGWAAGAIGEDPRAEHQGNLATETARYRGLTVNAGRVVLRYTVGTTEILELPGSDLRGGVRVFTRTFSIAPTTSALSLLLCDVPAGSVVASGENLAVVEADEFATAIIHHGTPPFTKFVSTSSGRVALKLPPLAQPLTFQVAIWSGPKVAQPADAALTRDPGPLPDLAALGKGGPAQWGAPLVSQGKPGTAEQPYVVDEIILPEDNRFGSWLRIGAHDFLPNGDAVLANLSGDVWVVSGLDEKLEQVQWRRFATGLFQPLGCRVVDGVIYILGRDRITRLRDLNGDGEADEYESFNGDSIVTDNYHEFALDLQTDRAGNFYYAKGSPWPPKVTSPHQGSMLKVSKDGAKLEVIATGLRAPNGLGMGPKDELTCSDNQGHWMPANRLNWIQSGGFYGMVTAAHRDLTFKKTDGTEFTANPSTEAARTEYKSEFFGAATMPIPTTMDQPLCWIPMSIDNSSGGEVWVPEGEKWGPLGGRMLQLSYGKCSLFSVLREEVDGVQQGGLVRFPLTFASGIMRGRFSPKDGQLYVSGLNVWQSNAGKFGCFTRVRYTGRTTTLPAELNALKTGVRITFTAPLDEKSAADAQNYSVERWNYKWTAAYGSPDFKVSNGKPGRDQVAVDAVTLSPDRKTVTLTLPDMAPCMQMKIKYSITAADGAELAQEIHHTIHALR